jgi:membrane protein DedA with SNARE-associated domain
LINFSVDTLDFLLSRYGYLILAAFVGIESIGIPFPGETMLVAAAIYAGHTHRLELLPVILAASAGAVIGDNIGFTLGRLGGYPLLRRYGHYIRLNPRKLKVGQYLFLRHGGKVVFFGRFVSLLRTWAAFLAGANRMHWRRFLAFNAAGGVIWASIFAVGGYYLGDRISKIEGPVGFGLLTLVVAVIIGALIVIRRQETSLEDIAEAAIPGPI